MKKEYEWLKRHNEHYEDTEWSEDNARKKARTDRTDDVPTREEDTTQHVSQCSTHSMCQLQVRPKNMSYVLVKPRPNQTDPDLRPRLPFAVDVHKVKRAYEWLRINNRHYKDVPWSDANADAWTNETEQVPTREEDITQHLSQCSTTLVKRWMSGLEQGEAGGQEQTASWKCRTAFGMDSDVDELWQNVTHYMGGHYRVVKSLTSRELYRAIVAKTLFPVGRDQGEALEELRERGEWEDGWEKEDSDQWPEDYKQLVSELVATRIAMEEETGGKEQHELGAVQPEEPEGDEEERFAMEKEMGAKEQHELGAVQPRSHHPRTRTGGGLIEFDACG